MRFSFEYRKEKKEKKPSPSAASIRYPLVFFFFSFVLSFFFFLWGLIVSLGAQSASGLRSVGSDLSWKRGGWKKNGADRNRSNLFLAHTHGRAANLSGWEPL